MMVLLSIQLSVKRRGGGREKERKGGRGGGATKNESGIELIVITHTSRQHAQLAFYFTVCRKERREKERDGGMTCRKGIHFKTDNTL